jgi:hypothetical protein
MFLASRKIDYVSFTPLTLKDLGDATLQKKKLICLFKIHARKSHLQFTSNIMRLCRIKVSSSPDPYREMTDVPLFCRLR